MNWELILFDLDGTLVDSRAGILHCTNSAFRALGLAPPEERQVARVVGLSLELALERLLPEGAEHRVVEVTKAYRDAAQEMRARPDFQEPLFPGVPSVLNQLSRPDVHLGIATGKNLTSLFSTLQTPDVAPSKPHPAMVERALAECGVGRKRCVMVGDSTFDMEMARNAGILAIGVSWGYHSPAELQAAGAAVIIDRPVDLPASLNELLEKMT